MPLEDTPHTRCFHARHRMAEPSEQTCQPAAGAILQEKWQAGLGREDFLESIHGADVTKQPPARSPFRYTRNRDSAPQPRSSGAQLATMPATRREVVRDWPTPDALGGLTLAAVSERHNTA